MGLFNLFRRFVATKGQPRRRPARVRLQCEELEGRLLLTSFLEIHTVTTNALVELTFIPGQTAADERLAYTVKDRDTDRIIDNGSKGLQNLSDINIFTGAGNDRIVVNYNGVSNALNKPFNVFAFGGSDTLELLNQPLTAADTYAITGSETGTHGLNFTFSGIDILKVGSTTAGAATWLPSFQFQPGGMITEIHALNTANGVLDLSALSTGMTVNLKERINGQLFAQGMHTVFGGGGNDTLIGSDAADFLFGNGGDDVLIGNGGNDVLVGGANGDWLYGDAGRDILIGGAGRDWLEGGADADIVINGWTSFDNDLAQLKGLSADWGNALSRLFVDAGHAAAGSLRQTVFDDNETDTFVSRRGTNDTVGDVLFKEAPRVLGPLPSLRPVSVGGTTIQATSPFFGGLTLGGDQTRVEVNWSV